MLAGAGSTGTAFDGTLVCEQRVCVAVMELPPSSAGVGKSKVICSGAWPIPSETPDWKISIWAPGFRSINVTLVCPAHSGLITVGGGTGIAGWTTSCGDEAPLILHAGNACEAETFSPSTSGVLRMNHNPVASKHADSCGIAVR